MAYVLAPIVNVSTPFAPASVSVRPSISEPAEEGESGLLISIICTPLSLNAVTMAYVLPSTVNVSTPFAPPSCSVGQSIRNC